MRSRLKLNRETERNNLLFVELVLLLFSLLLGQPDAPHIPVLEPRELPRNPIIVSLAIYFTGKYRKKVLRIGTLFDTFLTRWVEQIGCGL